MAYVRIRDPVPPERGGLGALCLAQSHAPLSDNTVLVTQNGGGTDRVRLATVTHFHLISPAWHVEAVVLHRTGGHTAQANGLILVSRLHQLRSTEGSCRSSCTAFRSASRVKSVPPALLNKKSASVNGVHGPRTRTSPRGWSMTKKTVRLLASGDHQAAAGIRGVRSAPIQCLCPAQCPNPREDATDAGNEGEGPRHCPKAEGGPGRRTGGLLEMR